MKHPILYSYFIWFIASSFYAYQYVLKIMPNNMIPELMNQYNIDLAIIGQFTGLYYIGYAIVQIPLGFVLDRFGPRKVLTVSVLLTSIGLLPIIFSNKLIYLLIGRLIVGIGSSSAILGTLKIITMRFSGNQVPRMLGYSIAISLLGAIFGNSLLQILCENFGYKIVVGLFVFNGLILASIMNLFIPEIKRSERLTSISEIIDILTTKKILYLAIFAGLLVGPLECFAYIWGAEFLSNVYKIDFSTSSYLPTLIFLGVCVGSLFITFIAEKNRSYIKTTAESGLFMAIFFIILMSTRLELDFLKIIFFLIGLGSSYQVLILYKVTTYVPENAAGLSTAYANSIIMLFGYGFHSLIGFIVKSYSIYGQEKAYIIGTSIMPISLFIGSLGFMYFSYKEGN